MRGWESLSPAWVRAGAKQEPVRIDNWKRDRPITLEWGEYQRIGTGTEG